jgi:hypothetical protein
MGCLSRVRSCFQGKGKATFLFIYLFFSFSMGKKESGATIFVALATTANQTGAKGVTWEAQVLV